MKIAIHQPNFLPWMGYFYKMAQCDTFVFLDHVEFTKRSYTKRVTIHKPSSLLDEQYLTVPLHKHSDHASINSLQLLDDSKWQKKISALIYQTYHKAPHYYQVEPIIERFFNSPVKSNSFSQFNIEIIKYVAEIMQINTEWVASSNLDISYTDQGVNLDIVTSLNADIYLSGMGAKKYQNETLFNNNKLHLEYSDYSMMFNKTDLPDHLFNKSILSYLAFYDIQYLREILNTY